MSTWSVQVGLVGLFALTCGALAAAWMRGRLGVAAVALFVLACGVWVLDFAAIVSGYHDADGFVDCDTDCTAVHYVSALGFLAPPLLISLSAFAMLVVLGRRWRLRRLPMNENRG